jgi:hypothetical protein
MARSYERSRAEANTLAAYVKTSKSGNSIAAEASRKSERLRLRMATLLSVIT